MKQTSVKSVIEEIGADKIAAELKVSQYSIRHAKSSGAFPASWYEVVHRLCGERGLDCPVALFNMRRQSGDAA